MLQRYISLKLSVVPQMHRFSCNLIQPIYLMEGDVLEGGCNAATGDIFISYEVIDDA